MAAWYLSKPGKQKEHWMTHNDADTVKTIRSFTEGKLQKPVLVQELYAAN
jgi:hypothetical protein